MTLTGSGSIHVVNNGAHVAATETGAGQWGSSLAMACKLFGLECCVYMVKVSYHQKPYRRSLMHIWGGEVFASPSDRTNAGRAMLAAGQMLAKLNRHDEAVSGPSIPQ